MASALMRMLTYLLCIAALPVIRARLAAAKQSDIPHRSVGSLIPAAAFALCLWIAAQADARAWAMIAALSLLGLGLYWLADRVRSGREGPLTADTDDWGEI